jgi:hypothetical protein
MTACEVCGNEYERSFTVRMAGEVHTFDCFECAIHLLAPSCAHCGCTVVGHGVEDAEGTVYCCSHCRSQQHERPAADATA